MIIEDNANVFIKRLFGFSLGPVISAFLGFIMTPVTTWLVVPEEFGKAAMYTLALTLTSMFIYLGLDQAFVREYNAVKIKNNLLWNCFLVTVFFSLIIAIIFLLLWDPLSNLLFGSSEKFIITLLALSLPVAVFQRFNLLVIRMEEKAKVYSLLTIVQKLINLPVLILLLVYYEKSFKSIILAQFFSLLLVGLLAFLLNKEKWSFKFRIENKMILDLLSYGLPLVPAAIFMWLLNSMDKIALRIWTDFYEIGIYSAAFRIVMILEIAKSSFSMFWSPTAYRWYESGVQNEKFINVSHKLTVVLLVTFSLIIIFKDVIILILNQRYHDSAIIVPFLLFIPVMYIMADTTKKGINFSRKTIFSLLVTGCAAGINLIGNYILVPMMGALGASIATGISFIVFFWINTLISRKLWFKFKIVFYIVNILLMLLLATIAVFCQNILLELLVFALMVIYNMAHLRYLYNIGVNILKMAIGK